MVIIIIINMVTIIITFSVFPLLHSTIASSGEILFQLMLVTKAFFYTDNFPIN